MGEDPGNALESECCGGVLDNRPVFLVHDVLQVRLVIGTDAGHVLVEAGGEGTVAAAARQLHDQLAGRAVSNAHELSF